MKKYRIHAIWHREKDESGKTTEHFEAKDDEEAIKIYEQKKEEGKKGKYYYILYQKLIRIDQEEITTQIIP